MRPRQDRDTTTGLMITRRPLQGGERDIVVRVEQRTRLVLGYWHGLYSEESMNVCRRKPIPAIYTQLEFVRKSHTCMIADCPEDLPRLQQLEKVVAGDACVSEIERPSWLIVKAEFPDDILIREGTSDTVIEWRIFYWKLWDAESLVGENRPAEAVRLTDAGIGTDFLDSLAHPTSCLPMLRQTEVLFSSDNGRYKGYELKPKRAAAIKEMEKSLIAGMKLRAMKQFTANRKLSGPPKAIGYPQVPPKLRDTILRKNNYRCMFCGKNSSDEALEVHHIISRKLINKLCLNPDLHTVPENLCVTCFSCNRGKSDNLTPEDIAYYRDEFSNPEHPNHGLLVHLAKISELQTL